MTTSNLLAPPSDTALEAAVLGALLQSREAVGTVLALLRNGAAVFYRPAHQVVYRAVQVLHARGDAVDPLTVVQQLRSDGLLEKAGGAAAMAGLVLHAPADLNLTTYCLLLIELHTKRRIGEMAAQLHSQALDPTHDPHELLATAQLTLNKLHDTLQLRRARTAAELFPTAVDEIVAATQAPGGLTGVPSGLWSLDKVTGGWQPSDLIIIAARPGMGKTSASLAMAAMAEAAGVPGLFVSLEMGAGQLVKKLIATELGYTTSQLTKGANLTRDEAESIRTRAAGTARSRLLIDDTPGLSVAEFRAKAAKAVQEHGARFAMVDYLQLMKGDSRGNREQEISSVSRGLKLVAKELNIPVLAMCQLSRAVETRGGDKKPQLSDLRESGAIEQDADVVAFPHRAEYYGTTHDAEGNSVEGLTEFIIAKHRNGALANVLVRSHMPSGRYEDLPDETPDGWRPGGRIVTK